MHKPPSRSGEAMATTQCPHRPTCGLPGSIGMKAALQVWESFYCEGCFGRCERLKLREAGHEVPARLLPNGRLLDTELEPLPATSRSPQAA
jgi:hypothetical protein